MQTTVQEQLTKSTLASFKEMKCTREQKESKALNHCLYIENREVMCIKCRNKFPVKTMKIKRYRCKESNNPSKSYYCPTCYETLCEYEGVSLR